MLKKSATGTQLMLLAAFLGSSVVLSTARVQSINRSAAAQPAAAAWTAPPAPRVTAPKSQRGADFYRKRWGIDNIIVRVTASGVLIRFSYRVVDAEKAALINDKAKTPYLIEEKTGLALQIPAMEKVGQLRQTAKPENGREYWMAFSNKGKFIKPGSRVDIVIGSFRINDLVVE